MIVIFNPLVESKFDIVEMITLGVAFLGILISVITLNRDKTKRQYDMLYNNLILVTNINLKINEFIKPKLTKKEQMQLDNLTVEYINTYDYISFLINHKQIDYKLAYDYMGDFFIKFFEGFEKKLDKENNKELFKLYAKWKSLPPNSFNNIITAYILGYY
ncbi:MAG: hypothetical protein WC393_00125 [Candidatus Nanoarchaeia archaeon]|jgi:hypothetical protein